MRILFVLLLCLSFWTPAFAEVVVVMRPWVQVRAQPKDNGKPIAIVYANDSYEVIEEQTQWVRIRAAGKSGGAGVAGWVPRGTVEPIVEPIARKSFAYAVELKNAGNEKEARAKLYEVMRRFPGTLQSYESTRRLLAYHPGRGPLPDPKDGIVDPKARKEAERIQAWLFVEEGMVMLKEERYAEAVSMFEEARVRGTLNRSAMDGIRIALQAQYRDGSRAESKLALVALKSYFPNVPEAELEKFEIPKFAVPKTVPPQLAPLVSPGAPILEGESDNPELHEFEQKELELAPSAQSAPVAPEQAPANPAPEQESTGEPNAQAPAQNGMEATGQATSPAPSPSGTEAVAPAAALAPAKADVNANAAAAQMPAKPDSNTAASKPATPPSTDSVKNEQALAAPMPERQEKSASPDMQNSQRSGGLGKPQSAQRETPAAQREAPAARADSQPAYPPVKKPARRRVAPAQANLSAPSAEAGQAESQAMNSEEPLPRSIPPGFVPTAAAGKQDSARKLESGIKTEPMPMAPEAKSAPMNSTGNEVQSSPGEPSAQDNSEATEIARTLKLPGMKGLWPVPEAQAAEPNLTSAAPAIVKMAETKKMEARPGETQKAGKAVEQTARKPLPPSPPPSLNELAERPRASMARNP